MAWTDTAKRVLEKLNAFGGERYQDHNGKPSTGRLALMFLVLGFLVFVYWFPLHMGTLPEKKMKELYGLYAIGTGALTTLILGLAGIVFTAKAYTEGKRATIPAPGAPPATPGAPPATPGAPPATP